jgi:hypothetical protein
LRRGIFHGTNHGTIHVKRQSRHWRLMTSEGRAK